MKRRANVAKRPSALIIICALAALASPAQTFTTLFSFGGDDGAEPFAGLVQATNGDLYGTTYYGGAHNSGTVFKITPGSALTSLYSFCSRANCADGRDPNAALVQATNGDLYGTAPLGGAYGGGTVFKVTLSGELTTLYSFCSLANCADGSRPYTGLVQATSGEFYGTTVYGVVYGNWIYLRRAELAEGR